MPEMPDRPYRDKDKRAVRAAHRLASVHSHCRCCEKADHLTSVTFVVCPEHRDLILKFVDGLE